MFLSDLNLSTQEWVGVGIGVAVGLAIIIPWLCRVMWCVPSLRGKVVFITGGSQGIGLSLAEEFAKRGARVVLMARSEEKLKAAVEAILAKTPKATAEDIGYVCTDVTSSESVKLGLTDAIGRFGCPDILVTSAGASYPGYFLEQDEATFERTMDLNYMGNVRVIKQTVPHMIENGGGRVLIVASATSVCGFIGYGSYAPSKFALRGLADCLRNELIGFGIKVSICYPPDTDTPGFKQEMLTKPKETVACFPADPYPPEKVARSTINSFLLGDFHIQSPDFLQNLLVSSMSGINPRAHFLLEVLLQPLICLVQWPFYKWFDRQARSYAKRVKNDGSHTTKQGHHP